MRIDSRDAKDLRPITIERHYTKFAPGSVLVSFGDTKVLCTVCVEEKVPGFMRDTGKGWLTAEYSLLPGSTSSRARREVSNGKPSGRTSEIQRLIGRSLRSVLDFDKCGERTFFVDCDVIQADGGTRTAAITGSMVALVDAIYYLQTEGKLDCNPIKELLAAVSVGVVEGQVLCDLCYEEDFAAEVDMNVVMTESGTFVEVQGTAEESPFTSDQLQAMLSSAENGISALISEMKIALQK